MSEDEKEKKEVSLGGRKHLDGSDPGDGSYLVRATVTLRQEDIALIEELGGVAERGRSITRPNRSAGIRKLVDHFRENPPL